MQVTAKPTSTVERIEKSASQLFARQGYRGTSTREIARLARVSENTLFRHFERKEDLFWSVLRSQCAGLRFRHDLLDGLSRTHDPETVLPHIIELFTETASFKPELLRLMAVAFVELQWKAEAFCQDHLSEDLSAISHYLKAVMKTGKIRDLDPDMLTTALLTTTLMHPGMIRLLDGNITIHANTQDAARTHARFWLELLTPRATVHPWPVATRS
jgi:AcrR family transcriptional regulator